MSEIVSAGDRGVGAPEARADPTAMEAQDDLQQRLDVAAQPLEQKAILDQDRLGHAALG